MVNHPNRNKHNSQRANHAPHVMERDRSQHMRYSFRNWSAAFRCPYCGRSVWASLNFLGQRSIICTGDKTIKSDMTLGDLRRKGVDLKTLIDTTSLPKSVQEWPTGKIIAKCYGAPT